MARNALLQIRVTSEELEVVKTAASEQGMSVSDYMRRVALAMAKGKFPVLTLEAQAAEE